MYCEYVKSPTYSGKETEKIAGAARMQRIGDPLKCWQGCEIFSLENSLTVPQKAKHE
jgi:hypothetical protein